MLEVASVLRTAGMQNNVLTLTPLKLLHICCKLNYSNSELFAAWERLHRENNECLKINIITRLVWLGNLEIAVLCSACITSSLAKLGGILF